MPAKRVRARIVARTTPRPHAMHRTPQHRAAPPHMATVVRHPGVAVSLTAKAAPAATTSNLVDAVSDGGAKQLRRLHFIQYPGRIRNCSIRGDLLCDLPVSRSTASRIES